MNPRIKVLRSPKQCQLVDELLRTAKLLSISLDGNESIQSSTKAVIVLSLEAAYNVSLIFPAFTYPNM